MTNSELYWWYKKYNRRYFGGKLPPVKIRFGKLDSGTMAHVFLEWREMFVSEDFRKWPTLARMNILHEMVHLKLGAKFNHGPRFHKEMLRLAKAGAFKELW